MKKGETQGLTACATQVLRALKARQPSHHRSPETGGDAAGGTLARFVNRFGSPTFSGYRDVEAPASARRVAFAVRSCDSSRVESSRVESARVHGSRVEAEEERCVLRVDVSRAPTKEGRRAQRGAARTDPDLLQALAIVAVGPSGYLGELQVHCRALLPFSRSTHRSYAYFRNYFSGPKSEEAAKVSLLKELAAGRPAAVNGAVEDAVALGDVARLRALGDLVEKLGEFELGKVCRRRLVEVAVETSGKGSLPHASALEGEALLLQYEGRVDDAEPLLRSVLQMREKCLGLDAPLVGDALRRLAALCRADGLLDDALRLSKRDLQLRETRGGPHVAMALNNLAQVLVDLGRHDDAEDAYERAVAVWDRHGEAVEVATTLYNLSLCLHDRRKLEAAEPHARRALALRRQHLGDDSVATGASWHALGQLLEAKRDLEGAEDAYRNSVAVKERHYGFCHARVASSLRGLGKVLLLQRRFADAEVPFRRDVAISEDALGRRHPDLAPRYNNYAMLLWRLGRPGEALPFQEQALAIKVDSNATQKAIDTYRAELDGLRDRRPYPYGS